MISNDPRETWEAYTAAWGPMPNSARLDAFKACLDEGVVYTDPNIRTVGFDELADYMGAFQRQLPGGGFASTGFALHHDSVLVHWNMINAEGVALSPGTSFGTLATDGRLVSMSGFFQQRAE